MSLHAAYKEEPVRDRSKGIKNPWFAIRVRSNYEQVTAHHLGERGYEQFAPSYETERKWSDRKRRVNQFLFPGYVFSRFDLAHRLPILTIPGVVGLVGCGKVPSAIPDQEIENIRSMVKSGLLVTPWPFIQVGQQVLIESGPLAGLEGILEQVKGKFRLVVSVWLLQRSVSTEVDRSWVRPIGKLPENEVSASKRYHVGAGARR